MKNRIRTRKKESTYTAIELDYLPSLALPVPRPRCEPSKLAEPFQRERILKDMCERCWGKKEFLKEGWILGNNILGVFSLVGVRERDGKFKNLNSICKAEKKKVR